MVDVREVRLLLFSYLYTNLTDLISFWNISDLDIFYREVTENSGFFIHNMCMRGCIALIIGLSIDSRKSPQSSLFGHRFDISIDSRSTDFWLMDANFFIDIISGEMTAFTGITDDIAILMLAHKRKCQELHEHYENFSRKSKIYNENRSHYFLTQLQGFIY